MNNSSQRYELCRNTANVQLGYRLLRGIRAFGRSTTKLMIMLVSILAVASVWQVVYNQIDYTNPLIAPTKLSMAILLVLLLLAVPSILLWIWGGPITAGSIQRNLIRAGLTNDVGEAPTVIDIVEDTNNSRLRIYTFTALGIRLDIWLDKIKDIETALNVTVADIRQGKDNRHILVYAAPPVTALPHTIYWQGGNWGDTVLALGESVMGPVLVDLTNTPHILVGGSTGSGKTYLILSLAYQALVNGFTVYVMDMKGGVDYPPSWKHGLCHYADTRPSILSTLNNLVCELEERKIEFQNTEQWSGKKCSNLATYNALNPGKEFSRVLVVCDELAEVTDTTGADKATKEQITAITGQLRTLARLGRAFGFHLLLATQRPDSDILHGQAKNNFDIRICGRSDLVLSQILMDNGDAASLPKDIPGRFLSNINNGTIFQGFIHPDLEEGRS